MKKVLVVLVGLFAGAALQAQDIITMIGGPKQQYQVLCLDQDGTNRGYVTFDAHPGTWITGIGKEECRKQLNLGEQWDGKAELPMYKK